MLDVHRLRVLRSVIASGSIASAASNLGYTPSAISQHIAALQRETGLALLERAGRGLRPTEAGLAVAAEADAVLARLQEAERVVADLRRGNSDHLSLAYFASAGEAWLPEIVQQLMDAFPSLSLDLQLVEDDGVEPVARPDVQLVVTQDEPAGSRPGREAHRLIEDPYRAIVRDDHTLAGRSAVRLPELADERWIDNDAPSSVCRRILVDACAAAGFSPPFGVRAPDYATAVAFVRAGMGITVVPGMVAHRLPSGVQSLAVLDPQPTRSIFMLVRTSAAEQPAVRLATRLLASRISSSAA